MRFGVVAYAPERIFLYSYVNLTIIITFTNVQVL